MPMSSLIASLSIFSLIGVVQDGSLVTQIEQTPPTVREPIMAACMIEVADRSNQTSKLTEAEYRDMAKAKARRLSSMMALRANLMEEARSTYARSIVEQEDLYKHGLLSKTEYEAFVATNPEKNMPPLVAMLRAYPSCYLLDTAMPTITVRRAKELAGQ